MARINIETSIYGEFEFQELMIKVGDRHRAKGMLIELWTLAQQYWFPERKMIPQAEIQKAGLMPLVEAGLAEIRPCGGVYARGAEEAFKWLFQKQAAGMLSASLKKVRRKRESAPVQHLLTVDDRPSSSLLPSPNSLLPSPNSLLPSPDPYLYSKGEHPADAHEGIKSPVGFFIANYVNAYQQRYGAEARPALSGKVQGQIKRFIAETPLERACNMIQTYLDMSDGWFLTKAHDFGTFVENLSKVGLKLDTGTAPTRAQAQSAEKTAGYQSQLERIAEGTL